ncbi:toxin-antitoxin system HicB family antitoxin [Extensimonas perlucida]|uniref:toxin-antitoxin system HicB family antitoxin n=1 Tax=Extensimonas perlucida TaxID=2590786 RepID=UPI0011A34C3C|nr:toxin-antitoxin system HicB family antitoxin [Extensimonas perlucida]
MAVSVRMDPLLEKELALAAKRQGITKSQFIIEAVERALGRKDPAALYHKVMEESARYRVGEEVPDDALSPIKAALRQRLRAQHAQQQDDYAAYLAERETKAQRGDA